MKQALTAFLGVLLALGGTSAAAQTPGRSSPVVEAFEHYEGVRVALSADKLADVAPHAKPLAAQIEAIAGGPAKQLTDQLATAKTLDDARKHFGDLSTILVPVFQKEAIPGATAYICTMKNKPWIQKGDKIDNPYYGASMRTCGSPLGAKGK